MNKERPIVLTREILEATAARPGDLLKAVDFEKEFESRIKRYLSLAVQPISPTFGLLDLTWEAPPKQE